MKNFEKYEKNIKKVGYRFGVNKKNRKAVSCAKIDCEDCIFCWSCPHEALEKIKWLYEECKLKLTVKEVEELLKDKYPEGIEIIDEGV